MLKPFTLAISDAAREGAKVWQLKRPTYGPGSPLWSCYQVEPEAWAEVLIYSEDFPCGISIAALIDNMKRVRGMAK